MEIKNLSVYYLTTGGIVKAVNNVSFDVEKGESLGIAGESGSGKSTLANAILKVLKPPAVVKGKVIYQGKDLLALPENEMQEIRWKRISYIPQSSMNALNPVLKIKDQFYYVLKPHVPYLTKNKAIDMASESLKEVMLDPTKVLEAYPHELSGGMRQRVAIALAIVLRPEIVIADEPTTALDVVTQKEILKLLRDLKERLNLTLIIISHDVSVLAEVSDHLLIMYGGKVVEKQPLKDLLEKPLHPYTKGLISSIPTLSKEKVFSIKGEPPDLINPPPGCIFHPRCEYAMEICKKQEPLLSKLDKERAVACFLYSG